MTDFLRKPKSINSITRSLNIVTILTKQRSKNFKFCFVKIVTMFKFLVILFIIKLYARNNIFKPKSIVYMINYYFIKYMEIMTFSSVSRSWLFYKFSDYRILLSSNPIYISLEPRSGSSTCNL